MSQSDINGLSLTSFVSMWNAQQNMSTPDVHTEMAEWLEARWLAGDTKLLLMAFRGSGKSTLVGLFCGWLLRARSDVRILVLAAEMSLARKLVRNTKRVIERHPACIDMKPNRPDQWASEHFTINRDTELRDPSMLAKGMEANVTGTRADLIICDDVEVPKTCATKHLRETLRDRLRELDYILVPDGFILYLGTPHSYFSIYANEPRPEAGEEIPFLEGYARLTMPLIDGAGKSRWPERFNETAIAELQRRSGPNKFNSQMLLLPVNDSEGRLEPDRMRPYDDPLDYQHGNGETRLYVKGRRLVSASCFWDPAYGAPNAGDASVVAAVFTDEEGDYWLHGIRYLEHDPALSEKIDEATQLCRQVAAFTDEYFLPSVAVETNGLGKFLPGLLRGVMREQGADCAVIEHHSRQAKAHRILEAFDAVLAAGRLHVHCSVLGSAFVTEMREWRPDIPHCRDDGLDAVAGCLLNEPVRLPLRPTLTQAGRPARNWRRGVPAFKAKADFEI
jgi:hypothetical protein